MPKKRLTTIEFIEMAQKIHSVKGKKYDYSQAEYTTSKNKILIICHIKNHGPFWQRASAHLNGSGCPKCCNNQKSSLEIFIDKAIQKHGTKYDYSEVQYVNNKTPITIICHKNNHGKFYSTPSDHLKKNCFGCPKCVLEKNKNTKEIFIEQATKIHGNKYNYDNVIYINNYTKVIITCPKKNHGDFLQRPAAHLFQKSGCPICNDIQKTTTIFIIEANKIHDNEYDYSQTNYITAKIKVNIICHKKDQNGNEHGLFSQTPANHLNGSGCSKCRKNVSKVETEWLNYIGAPLTHRNKSVKIKGKIIKPDGYDPKKKKIWEFLGDFFHGNPKIYNLTDQNPLMHKTYGELYQKTMDRIKFLENAGYTVISIWESDWKKMKKNLKEKVA